MYLDPTALTDIVSISDAAQKGFRVIFDSSKENCFYVMSPKGEKVIRFPMKRSLYVRDNSQEPVECFWTSVEGLPDDK